MKSRDISSIMATLLMIAVAVSVSIIIFMWSQGFLSNSMQASASSEKTSSVLGAITIESVSINNVTRTMTITIRNIGLPTLHIRSILVQNNHGLFTGELNANYTLPKTVSGQYTMMNLDFRFRDFYTIRVFTLEGASAMATTFVDY